MTIIVSGVPYPIVSWYEADDGFGNIIFITARAAHNYFRQGYL